MEINFSCNSIANYLLGHKHPPVCSCQRKCTINKIHALKTNKASMTTNCFPYLMVHLRWSFPNYQPILRFIILFTHMQKKKEEKWIESRDLKRCLYSRVHGTIIHNSQEVEVSQVPIDGWIGKQSVLVTQNGVLFSHKKTKVWKMLPRGWIFETLH